MFRLWGKIFKDNHLLQDAVICDDDATLNRTRKVFKGIEELCNRFDLGNPIWLENNIREFQQHARTRFGPDSFMESIPFDFMEIHVIEED